MRFETYKSHGEYRWRLKAGNGEIVASGEGYENEKDRDDAITLVRSMQDEPAEIHPVIEEENPIGEQHENAQDSK